MKWKDFSSHMGRIPEDELRRLYLEEGWSIGRLADKYGVAHNTIKYYLTKYNIPVITTRKMHRIDMSTITPTHFYLLGVYLGDGCIDFRGTTYRFILTTKSTRFIQSVSNAIRSLGGNPLIFQYGKYPRVECYSKDFGEWLLWMKQHIEQVMNYGEDFHREFIRGLYESEGYCSNYRGPWMLHILSNTNPKLISVAEQVVQLYDFITHVDKWRMRKGRAPWIYALRLKGGQREIRRLLHWIRPCIKWPEELR